MLIIEALIDTYLKPNTDQSNKIPSHALSPFKKGTKLELNKWGLDRNHYWIELSKPINTHLIWFVFQPHAQILGDENKVIHKYQQDKKIKDFPFFAQYDNLYYPYRTCGPTSIAMCLYYFGVRKTKAYTQLEDEISEYMRLNYMQYGDPLAMKEVVEKYECKDKFITNGTISQIKKHLDDGNPCIVHSENTRSGHIYTIYSYNDKGFICHDPWGRHIGYEYEYDFTHSGKSVLYTYQQISRKLSPESYNNPRDIWVHFISK